MRGGAGMKHNMTEVRHSVSPLLKESLYEFTHKSGLRVRLIPKPGFLKKYAAVTVAFGSLHTKFVLPESGETVTVPEGAAHFLEHKLFEQPDFNVSDRFSALGANVNAGTGFNYTNYYFKTIQNFEECLRLLLHFVFHPHITEESVEREKGIICREITMYEESPDYVVSMNLFRAMYLKNPVRNEIAGTEHSVAAMTKDDLLTCYHAFYRPCNMMLTVSGDITLADLRRVIEECDIPAGCGRPAMPLLDGEPRTVTAERAETYMEVAAPVFCIGFKDNETAALRREELYIRERAGSILREMLFGRASDYFEKLYRSGKISQSFYTDYDIEREYALLCIGGDTLHPEEVLAETEALISQVRKKGLSQTDFERINRSDIGDLIGQFNSPEAIGRFFASAGLMDCFGFDYFDACVKITMEDVRRVFEEVCSARPVLSVVWPRT